MDNVKVYKTATAFRKALKEEIPLERLRRRVAFNRFLAHVFQTKDPRWILKGGYALEFRKPMMARTTKDIDFSIPDMDDPNEEKIRSLLQDEMDKDIGDWFTFLIGKPMQELDQAIYGGWRFPIEARVDNREFSKFHLDVGVGDAIVSAP